MVLTLSGATQSNQAALQQYLKDFSGFSFLWQEDVATQYAKFVAQSPDLEVKKRDDHASNAILLCIPQGQHCCSCILCKLKTDPEAILAICLGSSGADHVAVET